MRYTLLEMVQQILSAMDSDEINSIDDTVESSQVALLIKGVYYDLATELGLPEHDGLFELIASGDNAKPTLMTVPANVVRLDKVRYNHKLSTETYSRYEDVTYQPFDIFQDRTTALQGQTSGVGEMSFTNNDDTFEIMYRSDVMPTYYTSIDDFTLIFDAYLALEDTTLQKSKTQCSGSVYPEFTLSDEFTPDLDPDQFSYFLNRAKVRAFAELKQVENVEAAREARNQKIRGQRSRRRVPDRTELERLPNYGRK